MAIRPDTSLLIVDQRNHSLRLFAWYQLPADLAQTDDVQIVWNDRVLALDEPVAMAHDRVMAPVRALAEAFGHDVTWHDDTDTAVLSRDGRELHLQAGETEVTGEVQLEMDVAPYVEQSRLFAPLRILVEAFGKQVDWLADRRVVLIRD